MLNSLFSQLNKCELATFALLQTMLKGFPKYYEVKSFATRNFEWKPVEAKHGEI